MLIDHARAAMDLVPAGARRRALDSFTSAARRIPNAAFTAPMGGRIPLVRPRVSRDRLREALAGRHVVLTGATSGIGLETARALGRAQASVTLVARGEDRLEEVIEEITFAGGRADHVRADLSDPGQADAVVAEVCECHGGADVLVNNAGHSIRRRLDRSYDRPHDFERTMALNYFGPVHLILGFLPGMRERGDGHIVNISTLGAEIGPEPRFAAYLASKAALDAFAASASPETAQEGVDWTTVYMPLVHTPMIKATALYRAVPTLTPRDGSQLVQEALVDRPRYVSTPVGRLAGLLHQLSPSAVEAVFRLGFRIGPDEGAPDRPGVRAAAGP